MFVFIFVVSAVWGEGDPGALLWPIFRPGTGKGYCKKNTAADMALRVACSRINIPDHTYIFDTGALN